jgi:hypothetical protein
MTKQSIACLFFAFLGLTACETVVNPTLEKAVPTLVIDAFIDNEPKTQTIRLSKTVGYLDNATQPPPVLGATVQLTDDKGNKFAFIDEKNNGNYTWQPSATNKNLGTTFVADSKLNRVPNLDSLGYEFRKAGDFGAGTKDGYFLNFFAKEFPEPGDCYRIKSYRNDTLLNAPQQLNIAYDVYFFKGIVPQNPLTEFIFPIRNAVNDPAKPFKKGDKCRVEILSITEPTFEFFTLVREQQTNTGLFATPPSNVPTNFVSQTNAKTKVVGWFSISALSARNVEIK